MKINKRQQKIRGAAERWRMLQAAFLLRDYLKLIIDDKKRPKGKLNVIKKERKNGRY